MTLEWQGAWQAVIHHPLFGIGITLGAYQLVLAGFEKTRRIFLQPVLVSMLLVIGVLMFFLLPESMQFLVLKKRKLDKVAQWLNAGDTGHIVFTHGATSALNLLAYGLEHLFNAGDEIAISALEHHANLLPWQQLAKRRALSLVVLPLGDDGVIDLEAAATLIGPRTRLLAVSQLSKVLGAWQPLEA